MDTKNTLTQIEALPLPHENRDEILAAASAMTEEQQKILLDELSKRLDEYAEDSLSGPAAVLADFAPLIEKAKRDIRNVSRRAESMNREQESRSAEASLQQSL